MEHFILFDFDEGKNYQIKEKETFSKQQMFTQRNPDFNCYLFYYYPQPGHISFTTADMGSTNHKN